VHVPFSFVAAEKTLPAGEYTVTTDTDGAVLIRRTEGREALFALAQPTQSRTAQAEAMLVFYRFGERYFLSEIWPGGAAIGRHLPVGPGEHLSASSWPKTRVDIMAAVSAARKGKK
jgi:hypothetical protein